MRQKVNALLPIAGVSVIIFLSQLAFAQKPAPGFVPIPDDIGCSVEGMSFMSTVGPDGQLHNTDGSANGVICWMKKTPDAKKAISLASTKITKGMLATKEFGNLQITPVNSITSGGLYMAIGSGKLKSFRQYLQK